MVRSSSCLRCKATVLVRPRREGEESLDDDDVVVSLRSVPRNVLPASKGERGYMVMSINRISLDCTLAEYTYQLLKRQCILIGQ